MWCTLPLPGSFCLFSQTPTHPSKAFSVMLQFIKLGFLHSEWTGSSWTVNEPAQGLGLVLSVTRELPGFAFLTAVSSPCCNDVSWAILSTDHTYCLSFGTVAGDQDRNWGTQCHHFQCLKPTTKANQGDSPTSLVPHASQSAALVNRTWSTHPSQLIYLSLLWPGPSVPPDPSSVPPAWNDLSLSLLYPTLIPPSL